MASEVTQQEKFQQLWRTVYTAEKGWSAAVAHGDVLAASDPVLADINGTLYCAHRSDVPFGTRDPYIYCTTFTPAVAQPFVAALERAQEALPADATEEQKQQQQNIAAASEALDKANAWSPFSFGARRSTEPPAMVDADGALLMVTTRTIIDDGQNQCAAIEAAHLTLEAGSHWSEVQGFSGQGHILCAPGLAVFNGAVHIVFADSRDLRFRHDARNADGKWERVKGADGQPIEGPYRDYMFVDSSSALKEFGLTRWSGNVALAVHDGALHMVALHSPYNGDLLHSIFDGTQWTNSETILGAGEKAAANRNAALASFDGKLHAVYPDIASDKLMHTTWTKEGGWTKPVDVPGHNSRQVPALASFKQGPDGVDHDALMMIYAGISS